MSFQPSRLSTAAASVLAAGVVLTVASCSQLTPLGPDPAASLPQPHHLRSPIVLQDMRMQQPTAAGACPAGSVTVSGAPGAPGAPGQCYGKTGTQVTITSAAFSPVSSYQPPPPSGQQAQPVQYGFWITMPATDTPALTAVTGPTSGPQGPPTASVTNSALTISVAGRTWILQGFATRFTGRQFEVLLSSRNQALQLQRIAASG
jgi:hypothetical protein